MSAYMTVPQSSLREVTAGTGILTVKTISHRGVPQATLIGPRLRLPSQLMPGCVKLSASQAVGQGVDLCHSPYTYWSITAK